MTKSLLFTLLILSLFACTKEDTPEENENSIPSLSISEPNENFTVDLGKWFAIEGLAVDKEGLKSVHYEITTPNASYNYVVTNSLTISGFNTSFQKWITIPETASVGDAVLKIWAFDTDNNQTETITRNFIIFDNFFPSLNKSVNSVNHSDLISLTVFRNINNIVDSVFIMNQTTSDIVATVKEIGGLKKLNFTLVHSSSFLSPLTDTTFNFTETSQNSFTYQIPASNVYGRFFIGLDNFNKGPKHTPTYTSYDIEYILN